MYLSVSCHPVRNRDFIVSLLPRDTLSSSPEIPGHGAGPTSGRDSSPWAGHARPRSPSRTEAGRIVEVSDRNALPWLRRACQVPGTNRSQVELSKHDRGRLSRLNGGRE